MEEQVKVALLELLGSGNALGFCDPPKPIVIYANRSHANAIWYTWDFDNNVHIPIEKRAIACVVTGVNVVEKEYKNKPDKKFQVQVQADRAYTIESGLDTQFAKGLIASLDALGADILKPIVIEAEAGDTETVLFCRVYLDGKSVRTPKHEDIDFVNSLGRISLALGGATLPPASTPNVPSAKPVVKPAPEPVAEEEEAIEYEAEFSFDDAQLETVKSKRQEEFYADIKAMTFDRSESILKEIMSAQVDLGICFSQVYDKATGQLAALEKTKATIGRLMKSEGISGETVGSALGKLMGRPTALAKECPLSVLAEYAEAIAPVKVLDEIPF